MIGTAEFLQMFICSTWWKIAIGNLQLPSRQGEQWMCCTSTRVRLLTLPPTACTGWQWMDYISGQWSRLRTGWMIGPRSLWHKVQLESSRQACTLEADSGAKAVLTSSLMARMLRLCTSSKFTDGSKQRRVPHIPHGCVCIQRDAARLEIWAERSSKMQQGELQNPASGMK